MGSCCSLAVQAEKEGQEPEKGFGAWLERVCGRLETGPFLAVGGLCLLASFLLTGHGCHGGGRVAWWNPAFATVFICGVPILREAVESLQGRWACVDVLINNAGLALGLEKEYMGDFED